jgi:hypothetical protein
LDLSGAPVVLPMFTPFCRYLEAQVFYQYDELSIDQT